MENNGLKEKRISKMVEEIEDYAILLLDKEGNIENWNKGAEQIKGYKANEIIGKNFEIFYTEYDRRRNRPQYLIQLATRNGHAKDEGWRVRKDGTQFWGSILITAIHDENNEIIGYTKVTRDLTAAKENSDKMLALEERYLRMIRELQDYAVLLLDTNGNIEDWNTGAEQIKGYTAADIIGKNFRIFYTADDVKNKVPEAFLEEARINGRAHHEGWRVRKDGTRFWGSVVITALHNNNGNIIGYSKLTRDLTEKKLVEDAQKKYTAQLETRNREMEELAYIASHDLQEPLRTINNFLDLFQLRYKSVIGDEGKMYINVVQRSAGRMQELIRAILDYSILGTSKEISEIDCNVLLADIKDDLSANIIATGTVIKAGKLPVLHGHNTELRMLFQNLIANAIKFRKPDIAPEIIINAAKQDDQWLFTITDNGIGMDKGLIHKIFLIFQRLHSRKEYPGTGIGLAYAKKITELHNGRIWAESEEGKGSTFYFLISDMHLQKAGKK